MPTVNETILSEGSLASNDLFLSWYADKNIYTSGLVLDLAVDEETPEYVTPQGCIGYSIQVNARTNTTGVDPNLKIIINGVRFIFPYLFQFNPSRVDQNTPLYKSPCFPYVEIKDAISFINNTNAEIDLNLLYYRLKYRDR